MLDSVSCAGGRTLGRRQSDQLWPSLGASPRPDILYYRRISGKNRFSRSCRVRLVKRVFPANVGSNGRSSQSWRHCQSLPCPARATVILSSLYIVNTISVCLLYTSPPLSAAIDALFIHPRQLLPQFPSVTADEATAARIRSGRSVNLPELSRAREVKVFFGQRDLLAIATRVAGTLFHPKIVFPSG